MKNRTGVYLAVALAGIVTAGCSSGPVPVKTVARVDTPSTVGTEPTTTTMAPTTTTVCAAAAVDLQGDQARLDSLVGGRRQAESAVAQIQLVVDNAGRSIESYRRTLAGAQHDYDLAVAYAGLYPGLDSAEEKLAAAADNLADWKGIVASWEATRAKALGDLARGKATLADWDKQISQGRQAVAGDRAAQATLTCS